MNKIPAATNTAITLNIGILGTGALGSLMAYHWQQQSLFALPRDQHSTTPITVLNRDGELWQQALPAWSGEALDWLVVCTKAAATLTALSSWQALLHKVKRILLLQNGMGQHDECATWLSQQQLPCELWAGMSTEGAYKETTDNQSARVIYAGAGESVIAPWQADVISTAAALPNCHIVADIHSRLRAKLAVNAVINPLTALFKCPNGELLTNSVYRQQLDALTAEVAQLYQALNWPLSSDLTSIIKNVAEKTAHNKSSTLQDILNKRPTELPYICGYLLTQAQQVGMSLPITQHILQQLSTTNAAL